jgi:hypothetical protein
MLGFSKTQAAERSNLHFCKEQKLSLLRYTPQHVSKTQAAELRFALGSPNLRVPWGPAQRR